MTSRTALLAATFLAVSAPAAALARPTIVVDAATPFSADELANAVSIRGESDAQIDVKREGDVLVITVGPQARALSIDPAIAPHDLARVVALIIVALDASPAHPAALPIPSESSPGAITVASGSGPVLPRSKAWTLRLSAGMHAEDGGDGPMATATMSRRLSANAHVLIGASLEYAHAMLGLIAGQGESTLISAKAGLELRRGWAALEGGLAATRIVMGCEIEDPKVSFDPYGVARVYLVAAETNHYRMFVEAGVKRVSTTSACVGQFNSTGSWMLPSAFTTVHGAFGIEVPL